jgi:hypothetical protein
MSLLFIHAISKDKKINNFYRSNEVNQIFINNLI